MEEDYVFVDKYFYFEKSINNSITKEDIWNFIEMLGSLFENINSYFLD